VVKALTEEDVTIVATIHSPTANTFMLFDRCGAQGAEAL
jgi:hypothetical protein